ncbi:unnamed protein product, partial [Ascophyllum nodosum]
SRVRRVEEAVKAHVADDTVADDAVGGTESQKCVTSWRSGPARTFYSPLEVR